MVCDACERVAKLEKAVFNGDEGIEKIVLKIILPLIGISADKGIADIISALIT